MDVDTFSLIPITVDPSTKVVQPTKLTADAALQNELNSLNALARSMIGLDTPNSVPPPPLPVNPKRSQQIQKLRESGNNALKHGDSHGAIRMYSLGIEMALGRPSWEPQGLVREEVSALYANRAQAHMTTNDWPEGVVDAKASLEMKRVQNSKGWWRLAKCMFEMGRLEEARDASARGLEFEHESDLLKLKKETEELLENKAKA